jgi:hypothetical protein
MANRKPLASAVRFRAELELAGKTATGIVVPDEVVERLGAGKRVPVRATIGRHAYHTTVAPMGGRFMMPVSAENREKAGVVAGDTLDIELELDTAPREVDVPPDLATALDGNAKAKRFFEGPTGSQKQWFVTQVASAKKAETRQRRILDAIGMLREGRKR